MHMHPLQKLHVKAANDNETDKGDFAWRILKILLVKTNKQKNPLTYLKGESISHLGTMYCLHFKMAV